MASLATITLELAAEDRERIDKLLAAFKRSEPTTLTMDNLKSLAQQVPTPEKAQPEPKEVQPEPEKPAPVTEVPAVTAEEVQAKVVELISAGKKAEVKAVVVKYAPRVGAIPEDKRADVMAELLKLEG